MHPGIWEKLGEALLWLQLCWIIAGFALMVYLTLKVFPKSGGRNDTRAGDQGPSYIRYDGAEGRQSLIAGNYRLEAFPQWQGDKTKILEFRPEITATKRRLS